MILLASLATIASPALQRLLIGSRRLAIENPSSLELALIAMGTIGLYLLGKRLVQRRRQAEPVIAGAMESDRRQDQSSPRRRAA